MERYQLTEEEHRNLYNKFFKQLVCLFGEKLPEYTVTSARVGKDRAYLDVYNIYWRENICRVFVYFKTEELTMQFQGDFFEKKIKNFKELLKIIKKNRRQFEKNLRKEFLKKRKEKIRELRDEILNYNTHKLDDQIKLLTAIKLFSEIDNMIKKEKR